ncbi:hypothetical protein ACQP1V_36415 [Microtetraspora malaysiensis]|uniref:hypothetical protein n=1 Tax=Microtetraspora malaysiensis TaxID=161358 RepID=UPI003D8B7154
MAIGVRPGRVVAFVDEGQTSADFPAVVSAVSQDILNELAMHPAPSAVPSLDVRIHMVRDLSGNRLARYEFLGGIVHVELIRDLSTELIAEVMAEHGTEVSRWFARR